MGQPVWPDGTPILGVTVLSVQPGEGVTFLIDLDLSPPRSGEEIPSIELLDVLRITFPNLPRIPQLMRRSDALDLLPCMMIAAKGADELGFEGGVADDLPGVIAAVCFRDSQLRSEAYEKTMSGRLTTAFMAILHEIKLVKSGDAS
jgi:hypothetical protein